VTSAALQGERVEIRGEIPGEAELIRIRDGVTAGSLVVRDDGAALFVERLWVEPEHRGYGLGTETARLVRAFAEAGTWNELHAWAPPNLGLAVYFWCRMGLRPLHGDGPNGGLAFVRTLR
jgi:GNAT superfamily N-acetyltransferase